MRSSGVACVLAALCAAPVLIGLHFAATASRHDQGTYAYLFRLNLAILWPAVILTVAYGAFRDARRFRSSPRGWKGFLRQWSLVATWVQAGYWSLPLLFGVLYWPHVWGAAPDLPARIWGSVLVIWLSLGVGCVLWVAWPNSRWRWYRSRMALEQAGIPVCWQCGHDLRGTPDRCPECGTAGKPADHAHSGHG